MTWDSGGLGAQLWTLPGPGPQTLRADQGALAERRALPWPQDSPASGKVLGPAVVLGTHGAPDASPSTALHLFTRAGCWGAPPCSERHTHFLWASALTGLLPNARPTPIVLKQLQYPPLRSLPCPASSQCVLLNSRVTRALRQVSPLAALILGTSQVSRKRWPLPAVVCRTFLTG